MGSEEASGKGNYCAEEGEIGSLGSPLSPVNEEVGKDGGMNSPVDVSRKSEEELDSSAVQFLDGGMCLIAEKVNLVNQAVDQVVSVFRLEYLSEVKKNRKLEAKLKESLRENDELRQRIMELEMQTKGGPKENPDQIEEKTLGLLTAKVEDLKKRLEEKENQLRSLKGEVTQRLLKSIAKIQDQIDPSQTQGGSSSTQIGEGLHAVGGQEQFQEEGLRMKSKRVLNTTSSTSTSEEQVRVAQINPTVESSLVDPVPAKRIKAISPRKRYPSSSPRRSSSSERNPVYRSPRRSREASRNNWNKMYPQVKFKRKNCPCGELLTSRELMNVHHCHFTERCKFICEICEHRFTNLRKLNQHLGDVHSDKLSSNKIGCNGCGKIYSNKERLWEHWRVSECLGSPSYL